MVSAGSELTTDQKIHKKQDFINMMNATTKELRGKIEERNHQGKYKKCANNIYMKLRKKATRENIKSAPTIFT